MALYEDVPDDKLTVIQMNELVMRDDPKDNERAKRIYAPLVEKIREKFPELSRPWEPGAR
jgi:hypothetical protein